jgi:NAD-dependent deacetylase
MKKIVVLTGAGISAESGLKTFRDSGGLWEEHRIEDVATFEGWQRNPQLVLTFYNERRKQLINAEPNAAHKALVRLEQKFDVQIITQNVDDLHERAGSSKVLHLHGELKKVRSTVDNNLVYDLKGWELKMGDKCEKGSQLRPHIVWFGEAVPMIQLATVMTEQADIFIVIGTSLNVYPAASLIQFVPDKAAMYLIDPNSGQLPYVKRLEIINENAGIGTPSLVERLLQ